MDIKEIKEINNYNSKGRIINTPVTIRKRKNEITELLIVCIGCSKDEYEEVKITNTLNPSLLLQLKGNNYPDETYIDQLIFLGNLTLFRGYESLVYKFPMRKEDIRQKKEPQFRLYTKTLIEQQNMMCYVKSLCGSAKESWKSIIRKVGSEYGIVFTYKVPKLLLTKEDKEIIKNELINPSPANDKLKRAQETHNNLINKQKE